MPRWRLIRHWRCPAGTLPWPSCRRFAAECLRRKKWSAQQGSTHFFKHYSEFDLGKARTTEFLWNVQPLKAHLFTHLLPHRRVYSIDRFHLFAHRRFRRFGVEKGAHGLAQFFLLFSKGKVHASKYHPYLNSSNNWIVYIYVHKLSKRD